MNWTQCVLSTIALIALGSCSSAPNRQESIPPASTSPKKNSPHLPTRCRHLLSDPVKWNPSTEEYTTDGSWTECMGVGRR